MQWFWAPLSALTAAIWFDSNHLGLPQKASFITDSVLVNTSVAWFSERLAVGFANASGEAFSKLPPSVQSQFRNISDHVNQVWSKVEVEPRLRNMSEQLYDHVKEVWSKVEAEERLRNMSEHMQVQATEIMASLYRQAASVSIDSESKQTNVEPLSNIAGAIWQSMELQTHVAIFAMEQFFLGVGVSTKPIRAASPLDASLVYDSLKTLAAELTAASSDALNVLLPRSVLDMMKSQSAGLLSAFQARFPQYRLDKNQPIRVLAFLLVWYISSLYLSCRALSVTLSVLCKLYCSVIIVVKSVVCWSCKLCRWCLCDQKSNNALPDSNSHNVIDVSGKQHSLSQNPTRVGHPSSGGG
jgi:hypothetical protein